MTNISSVGFTYDSSRFVGKTGERGGSRREIKRSVASHSGENCPDGLSCAVVVNGGSVLHCSGA